MEFQEGGGGAGPQKPKLLKDLKGKHEAKLEFPERCMCGGRGRVKPQNISLEGVWMFSGRTQCAKYYFVNQQTSSQSASEQFSITLVWYVTPVEKQAKLVKKNTSLCSSIPLVPVPTHSFL